MFQEADPDQMLSSGTTLVRIFGAGTRAPSDPVMMLQSRPSAPIGKSDLDRCREQPEREGTTSCLQSAAQSGCDSSRMIGAAPGVIDQRRLPRSLGCLSPHAF